MNADAIKLAHQYPQLYAAVGWHPEDSKNYDAAAEKVMEEQLADDRVVALGEIGLDYHWDSSPQDVQRKVFARQVAIAKEVGKPVAIHNRTPLKTPTGFLRKVASATRRCNAQL